MTRDSIETSYKHEQLKEIIRQSIVQGELKPGDGIPSQNEMSEKYGVGTSTVREAIGSLVHEGLLYRIQGKGTFVAERKTGNAIIGLVLPHLTHRGDIGNSLGPDMLPSLVHYIEDEAKKSGTHILLCLDNDDVAMERENILSLLERKVDGVIMFYIGDKNNVPYLRRIREAGMPLVLIDRYVSSVDTDYVVTDNFRGAYMVTESFHNQGFSRVIYYTPELISSTLEERLSGCKAAADKTGIAFEVKVVSDAGSSVLAQVEEATFDSVKSSIKPDDQGLAIFTTNAVMLPGAWKAVTELGLDHSAFALGSFEEPSVIIPESISRVHAIQPLEEMGRKSVQIVMGNLQSGRDTQHFVLEPDIHIVEGASQTEEAFAKA